MISSVLIFKTLFFLPLVLGGIIPNQNSNEDYIMGGNETEIEKIPYQVGLHLGAYIFLCGGTIISSNHILTAAHCLEDIPVHRDKYNIRSGSSLRADGGVVTRVKKFYKHPNFSKDYDIAILELETPLNFSRTTQPIKIAEKEPADGASVLVSGWGCQHENGLCTQYLNSVTVPMVNRKVCEKNYKEYLKITSRMVCAGVEGKDACQGDSGGPLVHKDQLVGIVSTGVGCGRKDLPGIYTNIAHPEIRDFIKKHAGV